MFIRAEQQSPWDQHCTCSALYTFALELLNLQEKLSIMKVKAPVGKILWFRGVLEITAEEAALLNPDALAHTAV